MADPNKNRKSEEDNERYPGYPHYPANEDLTNPENNTGKVNADIEDIALPDVRDIPGQERITPPPLGMLADTTISSADEEDIVSGDSLDAEEDDDVKIVMGTEADVTAEDMLLLGDKDKDMDMGEDEAVAMQGLDDTDEDGTPLNEAATSINSTGDDLDIDKDDEAVQRENIGEEDEENDYYSLGSDDNENLEHEDS